MFTERLLNGAFWSIVGEAGSRLLPFVGAIVLARLLGVGDFGVFLLIQSTLASFMIFASFSLGQATTRYIALWRTTEKHRISNLVNLAIIFSGLTGFLFAILLVFLTPIISENILKQPSLTNPLELSSIILFFSSLAGVFNGILRGFESFKSLAKITWVSSTLSFLGLTIGVMLSDLTGAIIGLVLSEIVRCFLTWKLALRVMQSNKIQLSYNLLNVFKEIGILWRFSLPSFLGGALHIPVYWLCLLVIGQQINGISELGLYGAAQKWMTLATFLPIAAAGVVGPILASFSHSENIDTHKKTTIKIALLQTIVCILPAAAIIFMSPLAMGIFGDEFIQGTNVLVWMMILAPISVSIRLFWEALLSLGYAWTSFFIWLLWAIVALFFTWKWQESGALGLVQSMILAYSTSLIVYIGTLLLIWRRQ